MARWIKIETTPEKPAKGAARQRGSRDRRAEARADDERTPVDRGEGDGGDAPPRGLSAVGVIVGMLVVVGIGLGGWWIGRNVLGPGGGEGGGGVGGGAAGTAGEMLATVGGEALTGRHLDVEFAVQKVLQQQTGRVSSDDPTALQSFRRELLSQMIDQFLLFQAAQKAGILVTDAEVAAGLQPMLGQYNLDVATLEQRVLAAGIQQAEFQAWCRRQVANGRFLQSPAAQQLTAGFGVSPDRVAAALQQTADVVLLVDGAEVRPVRQGAPAPALALPALDGTTVTLDDLRGKAVVLNFWATWCGPCKIEMPLFVNAYNTNKDKLVMLGVNVQEQPEPVKRFVAEYGLPFPIVLDVDGQVSTIYQVRALPTTVFVDAGGVVKAIHRGAILSRPDLQSYLDAILSTVQSLGRMLDLDPDLIDGPAAAG